MNRSTYQDDVQIALIGPMSVGKTTIAKELNKMVNDSIIIEEQYEDNQILELFYKELKLQGMNKYNKYALANQLWFLDSIHKTYNQKFTQQMVIRDSTTYQSIGVYAQLQELCGHMTQQEYETYQMIQQKCLNIGKDPLIFYLYDTYENIQSKIKLRNRSIESSIETLYLKQLIEQYEDLYKQNESSIIKIHVTDQTPSDIATEILSITTKYRMSCLCSK